MKEKRAYTIDRELDKLQIEEIKKNAAGNLLRFNIALRLNSLLRDMDKTQEWLANTSGVSVGSISSYCKGKAEPTATNIVNLAKALKVSCDFLLSGVEVGNVEIHEKLGLSNSAIEQLMSWKRVEKKLSDFGSGYNGRAILLKIISKIITLEKTMDLSFEIERLCDAVKNYELLQQNEVPFENLTLDEEIERTERGINRLRYNDEINDTKEISAKEYIEVIQLRINKIFSKIIDELMEKGYEDDFTYSEKALQKELEDLEFLLDTGEIRVDI